MTSSTPGDYKDIDNTGRSRFSLTFDPSDEGKNGYLVCRYINPRGERGPESEPLRFWII